MKITESMIRESINSKMDSFRSKALRGGVDGEDVADLFGYKELYSEGVEEEKEIDMIKDSVENTELSAEQEDSTETEDGKIEGFKTIDEFLKGTDTKVTVRKEGCEPSPIFGPRDTKNHNKYRVYLSNPKGKISFVFWDSIYNTEHNVEFDIEDAIIAISKDAQAYGQSLSFEDFKTSFGYDETNSSVAEKAYNGCRKHMERLNKLYTPEELEQLYSITDEM